MNVIPFPKKNKDSIDTLEKVNDEIFICFNCETEWVGPMLSFLEYPDKCPYCYTYSGLPKYDFMPEGEFFVCGCGNPFFYMCRESIFCPKCGSSRER